MKPLSILIAVCLAAALNAAADPPIVVTTNVVPFTLSGTWLCPANVTSVQVECWGAGGAGGSAARTVNPGSAQYGGGGAGGAYARYNSYPVTPGNTYYINVGAGGFNNSSTNDTTVPGGDTWFNSVNAPSSTIIAKGGAGGESAIGYTTATRYGIGGTGTMAGSVGNVVYAGGSGATGAASAAGGGGSSAGINSAGTTATSNIGAVAPPGGGNGGTGPTTTGANGGAGYPPPGGGGSGARDASGDDKYLRSGGVGGRGQVVLTYTTLGPAASATAAVATGNGSGTGGLTTYAQRTLITLTETPSAGTPPFTYAWKKVGSGTVLSPSNTLVVSSPVNGDQYTCDVAATWDGVVSTSPPATITVTTNIDPHKVVFIKADDLAIPQGQGDFLAANRALGLKVGIGFTINTVTGNVAAIQWIQQQQAAGDVEFWNHAVDHLQWTDESGNLISEYEGSGLTHMREHMELTQTFLADACGVVPIAFGTAYNGFDTDTATVINETTALRVFFTHRVSYAKSLLSPRVSVVQIYSESIDVGMPDADLFQVDFPPGTQGPAALQFHPSAFDQQRLDEYRKIVTYLLTNGYTILLPREFVGPETLIAGFNGSPTNGAAPLNVTFIDASSTGGTITNRFWNFGDGVTTNTTNAIVSHVYQTPSTNTVKLIVSDETGSSTNTKNNYIIAYYQAPQVQTTFTTSGTWVCPDNITSVKIECWGGGGGGGSASRNPGSSSTQYGGGGAGGAYARYNSYPVTPGNTYYINVGAGGFNNSSINDTTVPGGDSWFNSVNAPSVTIFAKGGPGGQSAIGNTTTTRYGTGGTGTTTGSAGDVVYAGGSGATGADSSAGGGGSSAGATINGNSATSNAGATAPAGGGNGGTGPTTSSGNGGDGFAPGGGGSGARDASLLGAERVRDGGHGASGKVILSYADNTPVDSVGDGIPDAWRAQYFGGDGTTTNADSCATADFDNDGSNNRDEYDADTDPTDIASRLAVISLALEPNGVRLTWIGGSNAWQSIENCSVLTDSNGWSPISTNTPPTAITNTLLDTGAGAATNRFYRIKVWR